ncbi:MAG: hypothetical protein IJF43_04845 [Firmicutes bacterium]|nr:hypothetical protein [Bacillota bacterium]
MRNRILNILLLICVAIGLVCGGVMLYGRMAAEAESDQVAAAIRYSDVELLAEGDGRTVEEWLADLTSYGIHYLVVTNANEEKAAPLAEEFGMEIGRSGSTAKSGDAFLMPRSGDGTVLAYDEPQGDPSVPLALIEYWTRTNTVMPADFDHDAWEGDMVKTLFMYDAYSYHYEYDEPATENENILFRAVVERGMRLIVVTPLEHEGGGQVSDPAAYEDLLSGLAQRIERYGLVYGDDFSALDAPKMNLPLFIGALLLLVALVVLLLRLTLKLKPKFEIALWILGIAFAVGGAVYSPILMQKVGAFGAAMVVPCYMALVYARIAEKGYLLNEKNPLIMEYVLCIGLELVVALCGGLYVAALMATRTYMFGSLVFAGVKLAQMVPLALTALLLFLVLFGKHAKIPKEQREKPPIALVIALLVLVVFALAMMVLRSGDNMIPIAQAELDFRNWLEYELYARPRTKEVLMAFPVLALFLVACRRRIPILIWPLGVLACVAPVSVVNTFCHSMTPVTMSIVRTLLGCGFGMILGILGMYVFLLLLGKRKSKQ